MKKKLFSLCFAFICVAAASTTVYYGIKLHGQRIAHQQMVQSEYDRVIQNAMKSMSGKDGTITDAEKHHFLKYLGITEVIQSGEVVDIVPHLDNNGVPHPDDNYQFDVILRKGNAPKTLGTFPKAKIEAFAADNIKWIED
jgi:hypothetical protein